MPSNQTLPPKKGAPEADRRRNRVHGARYHSKNQPNQGEKGHYSVPGSQSGWATYSPPLDVYWSARDAAIRRNTAPTRHLTGRFGARRLARLTRNHERTIWGVELPRPSHRVPSRPEFGCVVVRCWDNNTLGDERLADGIRVPQREEQGEPSCVWRRSC